MIRIKLALLIGGIALMYYGFTEWRLAQGAKETPQTISCADLSAKGPGDNANIVMTDSLVCGDSFVYEAKKNNPTWNKIWVPVVPKNGEYVQMIREMIAQDGKIKGPLPAPKNIKVILKSTHVSNESELGALANQESITGLVTNKIESLGQKERKILQDSYPGTDFTQCWIVDHDRKMKGMGEVAGLGGGGLALSLVGLVWMVSGSRSAPKV